ncbi:MAG: BrnT family toxin [Microvirga sp.]
MGENERTSWNDAKREENIRKHLFDFVAVQEVFDGRFVLVRRDERQDYGEPRYNMLVRFRGVVVNVTFTPRGDKHHLISVRPASRKERRAYHAQAHAEDHAQERR